MNSFDGFSDTDDYFDYGYERKRWYWRSKPDYSELTGQLFHMRKSMCGIGTNRLKRFLGRKIKEGDKVAEIFRTALDLEDANIMAKKTGAQPILTIIMSQRNNSLRSYPSFAKKGATSFTAISIPMMSSQT